MLHPLALPSVYVGFCIKTSGKSVWQHLRHTQSCCGLPSLSYEHPGSMEQWGEALRQRRAGNWFLHISSPKLWQSQVTLSMVPRKSLLHVSTLNLQAPTQQRRSNLGGHCNYLLQHCSPQGLHIVSWDSHAWQWQSLAAVLSWIKTWSVEQGHSQVYFW